MNRHDRSKPGWAEPDEVGAHRARRALAQARLRACRVAPATAKEIAGDLMVTKTAVKQHLLRPQQKFRVP